tara:strand:- start:5403 stop:7814 length:2412 start_codon:yes stop_codon:yes gene_type:complete
MGIGIALATGLVQGFTRNIQEEKARRAGEQEKLDSYRAILTETALDPGENYNSAAAKKLGTMIQNAQGRLDSRERVNIFGQEGDKVNVDFTDVLTTLTNSAGDPDFYTLNIGSGMLRVNKKYNDPTTDANDKANMFVEAMAREYSTPESRAAFLGQFQSDEDKKAFDAMYKGQVQSWISQRRFPVDGDSGVTVSINPYEQLPIHAATVDFLGWNENDDYTQDSMAAAASLDSDKIPENYVLLPVSVGGGGGATAVPLADIGFTNELQIKGLDGLASLHNMDRNKFVYTMGKKFGVQDRVQFLKGLDHAVNLFNLNAAAPKSNQDLQNIGEYLLNSEELKNDTIARAYAMAPFAVSQESPLKKALTPLGIDVTPDKEFADIYKDITGESVNHFDKRTSALFKGRKNLNDLIRTIESSGLKTEGLVANTFQQIYGFFGSGGTLDQIGSLLSAGGDYEEEGDEALIAKFMDSELKGVSKDIAAARTLAFIAAADLARAEDESGRLSDQDFLRNYQKLGVKSAGGIDAQLTAIRTVRDELDMKIRDVEVLQNIVAFNTGKKGISQAHRALISGDAKSKYFVNKFYDMGGTDGGDAPDPAAGMTKDEYLGMVLSGPDGPMPILPNVTMPDGRTGNLFSVQIGDRTVYKVDTGQDELVSISVEEAEKLIEQGSAAPQPAGTIDKMPPDVSGSFASPVAPAAPSPNNNALLPDEMGDLSAAPPPVDPSAVYPNAGPDQSVTPAAPQRITLSTAQAQQGGLSLPDAGLYGESNTGNVLYTVEAYPGVKFKRNKITNALGRQEFQFVEVSRQ